ncbi:substrate-binding periplasmic protein [Rheinheimera sp.]|uniref:substrate-binding periplasmic protein n=1 Tax=Rheinheimera sp. TaxID=1869214 RepID=UPI002FDCAB0F
MRSGLLLLSLLFFCARLAADLCPAEFRMPYNSSWAPYVEVHDESVTGTDIELIRSLLTQVGAELKLVPLPESRALNQLAQGQVDIIFAASYTKERAEYAWFSKAYRTEINQLIVHKQLLQTYPQINNKAGFFALAARRLAGAYNPKGYYGEEFEQLKQLPQVIQRSLAIFDAQQRLELVLSQRADYSIVDSQWLQQHQAQQRELPALAVLPFVLYQADIHLMFSKKTITAACVKKLNALLKPLKPLKAQNPQEH